MDEYAKLTLDMITVFTGGATLFYLYGSVSNKLNIRKANQAYTDITSKFGSIGHLIQDLQRENRKAITTKEELVSIIGRLYPSDIRKSTRLTELRSVVRG